jgi:hypothetical protein
MASSPLPSLPDRPAALCVLSDSGTMRRIYRIAATFEDRKRDVAIVKSGWRVVLAMRLATGRAGASWWSVQAVGQAIQLALYRSGPLRHILSSE